MELLSTFLFNTLAFIFVISVIVFIHEFGHYYIAKINGVKIEVFSIGFGPEIWGKNDKHGTRWKICAIPMGGYVKMFGDINPASVPDNEKVKEFTEEEKKIAFHTKSLKVKAAVVSAGPIANFILAILILAFFFTIFGKPYTTSEISEVMKDSAAAEAGLKSGDVITSIDGDEIDSFADIQREVNLNLGTPIDLIVQRGDESLNLTVTPRIVTRKDVFGNEIKAPLLGIRAQASSYKKLNPLVATGAAFTETYHISVGTLKAVGQMITGARSAKDITGPIGIAKYSGQSAKQGFAMLFWLMAVISINLGLINLFPIPVLDGGHLLYYAIEAVKGTPLADKYQQVGFKLGMVFVLTLAAFAIFNDIIKLNLF